MSENKMPSNSVEAEYMDIATRNVWPSVYQKLARESQVHSYTITEAKKVQNKVLNRYRDVNPYDHSRIILQRTDCDYINANLVTMERANRRYILTQGPLALTVSHFWLMVWEQESRAILMLNKVVEKGELKCHPYWPDTKAEKMELPEVGLIVEKVDSEDSCNYCTRWFRLTDTQSKQSREVIQFHYTTWPDFGVPSSPVAFLQFLKDVRACGALEPDVGPAIVHCSAGIGRSGTFCLVDSCLLLFEKEGPDNVKVQEVLLELRKCRMGLIQTPDQLRFSYQAIIEGAKRLDPEYEKNAEGEDIYSSVPEEEESPPPPPQRVASLGRRRMANRPLPPLPDDELKLGHDTSSTESEELAPTPPRRCSPCPSAQPEDEDKADDDDGTDDGADDGGDNGADDDDDDDDEDDDDEYEDDDDDANRGDDEGAGDATSISAAANTSETPGVRQRRKNQVLKERIAAMKRRARDAEWWKASKRSLLKPLTITISFVMLGAFLYFYSKR